MEHTVGVSDHSLCVPVVRSLQFVMQGSTFTPDCRPKYCKIRLCISLLRDYSSCMDIFAQICWRYLKTRPPFETKLPQHSFIQLYTYIYVGLNQWTVKKPKVYFGSNLHAKKLTSSTQCVKKVKFDDLCPSQHTDPIDFTVTY